MPPPKRMPVVVGISSRTTLRRTPTPLPPDEDYRELGRRTEGFSGSDISVVVKDVLMQPIRLLREATHFKKVRGPDGGKPDQLLTAAESPRGSREQSG